MVLINEVDYIPEKYKNKFIKGVDVSIIVNLSDGYFTIWQREGKYNIYLYSFFDTDEKQFYFNWFTGKEQSIRAEIEKEIREYTDVINYAGYNSIKEYVNTPICLLMTDIQDYMGYFFYYYHTADTAKELLDRVL